MINQAWKKTLAATAVMAAAPLVQAAAYDISFTGGSGVLTFSNCDAQFCYDGSDPATAGGLISALNAGQVNINGVGGAVVSQGMLDPEDPLSRYTASARANVTGATLSASGEVLGVQSEGGVELFATRNSTLSGGSAKVTNLRFDLTNKTIYADLDGFRNAVGSPTSASFRPSLSINLPNQALWTYDSISGPTAISPADLAGADPLAALAAKGFTVTPVPGANGVDVLITARNTISGLKVTTEGFNFFRNSLGLTNAGISALTAVTDYGVVNSTLNFRATAAAAVPEPETVGLALVGVIVAGVAARRRRQLQAA
ncbi:PEP-CTERM sorting domain-containing protein [Aquabacterium lacunae]|nr:PEP-CTERM sorting domain-containing protein [Aquabacterium lacunae]